MYKTILGCAIVAYLVTCVTVDIREAYGAPVVCASQACTKGSAYCGGATFGSTWTGTVALANVFELSNLGGTPQSPVNMNVTDCSGETACTPTNCAGDYPSWGTNNGGNCSTTTASTDTLCISLE
jgi:hypothetical protein